jgi:hypothetical protein
MRGKKDNMDKLLKAFYKKRFGGHKMSDMKSECPMPEIYSKEAICAQPIVSFISPRACPDLDALTSYINGSLHAAAKETIDEHLKRCKNCAAQVRSARETVSRFREGTLETPPEGISKQAEPWLPPRERRSAKRPKKK